MKYKKGRFASVLFYLSKIVANQMILRELMKTTIMAIGAM